MGRKTKGSTIFRSAHNQLVTRKALHAHHVGQEQQQQEYLEMKIRNRRKPIMVRSVVLLADRRGEGNSSIACVWDLDVFVSPFSHSSQSLSFPLSPRWASKYKVED